MLPAAGAGLSSCLFEGRLTSGGEPLETSVFDVDALRAVEYAMIRRCSVLICPADPLCPLSALVAATVHVDAMVRARSSSGRSAPSPLRVAVVTNDYHLRGFYRGLAVHERRGVGGVPMRSIVPAATVGAGGMLSVIDRDDGRWSTVFVNSVHAAHQLGDLDLLVVDLPVPGAEELVGSGVPTVVVARDPADVVALRVAEQAAVFGYDWAIRAGIGLGMVADHGSATRLANRACQQTRVVPVVAPTVCTDAGLFWGDLASLLRLAGRSPFVRQLVADAFGLFHDLMGLAMPVGVYEQVSGRSLDRRVEDLARGAKIVADRELRDEWFPMVEAELAGVLSALRASERFDTAEGARSSTKAAVLPLLVAEALDDGKDVLVVTRTAMLAQIYVTYLSERWPLVRVTALGGLTRARPADVAVLLGMAPTWGRWVYRSGAGRELAVLAYTTQLEPGPPKSGVAGCVGAPAGGFDETVVVRSAIGMQIDAGLGLSAPEQRARACAAVRFGTADGRYQFPGPGAGPTSVDLQVPCPPEVPPGLWSGGGWTAHIEPDPVSTPGDASGVGASEVAAGLRVVFSDGTWAWLHRHNLVWRWRRHSERVDYVEAGCLRVGDDLVFIDGDAHKTLLAKVLEVASEVPELAVAGVWADYWRVALGRAYSRYGTYIALGRALAVLGCRVQAQAVRLWCIGVTIGPDDARDVQRVGELLDDQVLKTHHIEVWQAMKTLRHAHVRLGRRLVELARSLGPATGTGHLPADEILDEASGLTAADIETAVVMVTVVGLEPVDAVPRILAGRRRDHDEPVDLIRTMCDEEKQ
jgi:hypothetical protein